MTYAAASTGVETKVQFRGAISHDCVFHGVESKDSDDNDDYQREETSTSAVNDARTDVDNTTPPRRRSL